MKRNCVEAAVSVVPSGLMSEFMPAHRIANVAPSGLSCERTASPATKLGYAASLGFKNCWTAPRGAVGVMNWPVATCTPISARAGSETARVNIAAPRPNLIEATDIRGLLGMTLLLRLRDGCTTSKRSKQGSEACEPDEPGPQTFHANAPHAGREGQRDRPERVRRDRADAILERRIAARVH